MNKKTRILSLLLCLTLVCSLFVTGTTALADDETKGSGIEVNKTAVYDEAKKEYTITLEAYATGEKTTSTVTKEVPTDIILVLDLSSSMTEDIGTVSYKKYSDKTNEQLYALRHNGGDANLWYEYETGKYASVSVTVTDRTETLDDTAATETNSYLKTNEANLRAKVNGEYVKVTVTETANRWVTTYTYTLPNGTQIASSSSYYGNSTPGTISNTDDGKLYLVTGVDSTNAVYTYTCNYTDSTGASQTKTLTSTGGSNTELGSTFYYRSTSTSGGGTRLAALKTACTNFADAVAAKCTTADGKTVNHRIAVVGFNTNSTRYTGTSNATAFIDMSTTAGQTTVKNAITNLATGRGTVPATGLATANSIFDANPVADGETRNRVIVFFTDGYPSTSGSSNFDSTLANNAITQADTAKNTYGATVYSVAVLAGADPTSAGNENGTNPEKVNWYLQTVSSNNGTPKNPGYYLAASDAASLNNIFQQISQQIETGGSSSTLDSEAVVKDIISPYFTLPEGADESSITINTYKCTGKDANGLTWSTTSSGSDGITPSVSEDGKTVSVTGFNFSKNWCGPRTNGGIQTYDGKKLVISFNVKMRDGFLGGNGVPTNDDKSGVYANKDATEAVEKFVSPTVDIATPNVTVTATNKNVYLLGSATAAELKDGATVTIGTAKLDLSETAVNFGLEEWQNAYVDITVTPADSTASLTEDEQFTVKAVVAPKTNPTADNTKTGEATANINVFKPVLTYKDSEAYYGAEYKAIDNLTKTEWKHGDTASTAVTMIGTEPTLDYTYTVPADATTTDNKINTTSDIPVKATVKIGDTDVTEYTTFDHTCDITGCTWTTPTTGGNPAFLIHVKTCSLTITKSGADTTLDPKQSFLFTVTGDNGYSGKVAVNGNGTVKITGLKVGTYTVTEDEGWSWRYTASGEGSATLSAENPNGSVTITNTRDVPEWLSGEAHAKNVFKETAQSADSGDKAELPAGGMVQEN